MAKSTLVISSLYSIVRQEEGKNDKCMHVVAKAEQTPFVHSGLQSCSEQVQRCRKSRWDYLEAAHGDPARLQAEVGIAAAE